LHVEHLLAEGVIEATPNRLREVDGIGPVRAASILAAWAEQKAVREIMVLLHSHGVGTARAVHIYKTYGPDAVQVMTENPYRLARDNDASPLVVTILAESLHLKEHAGLRIKHIKPRKYALALLFAGFVNR
jgi:exodeoxyribonuclease V alpha subunit